MFDYNLEHDIFTIDESNFSKKFGKNMKFGII